MTVDSRTFRDASGRFASGVCVVTTINEDATPAGVTISAFAFALIGAAAGAVLHRQEKRRSQRVAHQQAVFSQCLERGSNQSFANFAAQNHQKFVHVHGGPGENGCFCIEGCLVTLECRRTRIHDEGDHYTSWAGRARGVRRP